MQNCKNIAAIPTATSPCKVMGDPATHVSVHIKQGVAIVSLSKEPVNTLDLDMWVSLATTLEQLEADPAVRGAVFLSGVKRDVFTAGNDIKELYAGPGSITSRERYRQFWTTQNSFLARLYTSRLVTVAAIRGACPAGGCMISMVCDYRVMTDTGSIGLNESALGIAVPKFWGKMMQRLVGDGPADKLLQFAVMLSPDEAKALGLVDEVVPRHKLQSAAEAAMQEMLRVPDFSRAATKKLMREDFAREWAAYWDKEADWGWELLSQQSTIKKLGAVLDRLSGKKSKM